MTSPIPPDGGNFVEPIPPVNPIPSQGGGGPVPEKTHVVHFLGGTLLSIPNMVNLKVGQLKPIFKHTQHEIAKDLIAKFKPVLTELAVLALRSQQTQPRIEKPPASTPSESGTRRDEATAKGSTTLGKDLVNIEVHAGEMGQNDSQQQSKPQDKSEQPANIGMKDVKAADDGQKTEGLPPPGENAKSAGAEDATTSSSPNLAESNSEKIILTKTDSNSEDMTASVEKSENYLPEDQQSADNNLVSTPPKTEKNDSPQSLAKDVNQEISNEVLKQNAGKEPSFASQQVASKAAQETQVKPVETQPKDPNTNLASHKTNLTEENAPDQAIGLKEVPKSEESHVSKEKEIPKDVAGQLIDKENVHVHKKHEDAAVFAFLATRTQSDEPPPTAQHKMFQTIGNDPKGFVPPWLGLLLPELIKAKTSRDTKGGGQKGQKLQKPHKLTDILFMLIAAHIAGAKSLSEVFSFIQSREKWFTVVLGLNNGMPPRQLIFWFLTTLDPNTFDRMMRRWLDEVIGRHEGRSKLLDILLWETPLGFILGQTRRSSGNFSTDELTSFSDGFAWRNSVLMTNSDKSYGSLFSKIQRQGGHYLAEVDHELIPADEHESFESYLEGHERIVVQEWHSEEQSETQMKVSCEIIESDGTISRFERFLISDLESPAGYYFDLFRLQRSEESKCSWLLNVALSFPSLDEALQSCAATLNNLQAYAQEIISGSGDGSSGAIKLEMEKALASNDYLLSLLRKR